MLGDGFALSLQPLPFSCCAWRVHQLTVPKKRPLLSKCQLPNHLHQLLQSCPQPSFLLTQEQYLSSPPFSLQHPLVSSIEEANKYHLYSAKPPSINTASQ